jgi:hypothetical protein
MTSSVLTQFIQRLQATPSSVTFVEVIDLINTHYEFTPTRFTNGLDSTGLGHSRVVNEQGTNEGSCRIFAFAQLQQLTEEQTLHCFGDYYRQDVLANPNGDDHGNIRAFMRDGWAGVVFDQPALALK